MPETPARRAREAAGLIPEQVSRRARVSVDYLPRRERAEDFALPLARRLAIVYSARLDDFLPTRSCGSRRSRTRKCMSTNRETVGRGLETRSRSKGDRRN